MNNNELNPWLEPFCRSFMAIGQIGFPKTPDDAVEFMTNLLGLYCIVGASFRMSRDKLAENTKNCVLKHPAWMENNVN